MPILFLVALSLGIFWPHSAAGQWPGALRIRVVDAETNRVVPGAAIRLSPSHRRLLVGPSGVIHVRGLEPGIHLVEVSAPGYDDTAVEVETRNGARREAIVELVPDPMRIEGLRAVVTRGVGVSMLDADALRARSATTVADLARSLPGVVVSQTSPGGPETLSIRGSAADAVLVLVDGTPVNDPVTGEADLSTLPAAQVRALTVLRGGQSARYGPRASGGVLLVTTGSPQQGSHLSLTGGSLGRRAVEVAARGDVGVGRLDALFSARRSRNVFDFDLAPEFGGGSRTMANADTRHSSGRLGWTGTSPSTGTDHSSVGVGFDEIERGLPGRSFAPSPSARQRTSRMRAFGSIDRAVTERLKLQLAGYAQRQEGTLEDPTPPLGLPYDERTSLHDGGTEAVLSTQRATVGVSGRRLNVRSTALSGETPAVRSDVGAWASVRGIRGPARTLWNASFRVDRGSLEDHWFTSHDIAGETSVGPLQLRFGHRSSYSPPTLGDQYFREGVGVEANPELRAERVPSEWTAALSARLPLGRAWLDVDLEGFVGDVDGMILWQPDFRYVWSPRNEDIRRRGLDAHARAEHPTRGLRFWGSASWLRATYARASLEDVQIAYRPRHNATAGMALDRRYGRWSVQTQYTGARYPVANAVNELPGFWATDLSWATTTTVRSRALDLTVSVDRIFGARDAVLFAFPHPGRTLRITTRLDPRPKDRS